MEKAEDDQKNRWNEVIEHAFHCLRLMEHINHERSLCKFRMKVAHIDNLLLVLPLGSVCLGIVLY